MLLPKSSQVITLPKFRYLCQDYSGEVWVSVSEPYISGGGRYWLGGFSKIREGSINKNWRETLIDTDLYLHRFKNGLLIRGNLRKKKNG